jgi:hypothetical protein
MFTFADCAREKNIKLTCWLFDFTSTRPTIYANRLNMETPVFKTMVHFRALSKVLESHNPIIHHNDMVK